VPAEVGGHPVYTLGEWGRGVALEVYAQVIDTQNLSCNHIRWMTNTKQNFRKVSIMSNNKPMDESLDNKGLPARIVHIPYDFNAWLDKRDTRPAILGEVLQIKPIYVREVTLEPGILLQLATTPLLKRGYAYVGDGRFVFQIERQNDEPVLMLTCVGWYRRQEDADAWISESDGFLYSQR
jgi:hypothetical protein